MQRNKIKSQWQEMHEEIRQSHSGRKHMKKQEKIKSGRKHVKRKQEKIKNYRKRIKKKKPKNGKWSSWSPIDLQLSQCKGSRAHD